MSTIIKIKKSTGTSAPVSLASGELAYTWGVGTSSNLGDRLFIGTGTELAGEAANIEVIGGKYFTEMLNHTPGTLTASSALIVDSSSKIDVLNVDNLKLDGNTITSEDPNGNINITPNGTGSVVLDSLSYPQADGTAGQYLKTDGSGNLSFSTVISDFTISGDTGTDIFNTGETLTFTGGEGIDTTVTNNVLTIKGEDASTSNKGIASFNSADFIVTAGDVSIGALSNSRLDNSTISVTDGTNTTAVDLGGTITYSGTTNEVEVSESGGTITVGLPSTVSGLSGVSATTLTGTLQTAAQPNVTSLGTLNGISIAETQTISMGSNRVTNVANPLNDQDSATKAYVDAVKTGLDVKDSVRVASIGSLSLVIGFSEGQVIDGVTLVSGDRILIKDQTDGKENGIYTVNAAGVAPSRSADMDINSEISGGVFTFVEEGTVNADSGWVVTNNETITLDNTSLTFAQFSGAGQITAGAALTKTGNTLDVAVDNSSIGITTDKLNVKAGGITNAMLAGSIDIANKVTGVLSVVNGGTGASSLTANRLMMSNGTGALTVLGAGTAGQVMISNGAGAPAFADVDGGTF